MTTPAANKLEEDFRYFKSSLLNMYSQGFLDCKEVMKFIINDFSYKIDKDTVDEINKRLDELTEANVNENTEAGLAAMLLTSDDLTNIQIDFMNQGSEFDVNIGDDF